MKSIKDYIKKIYNQSLFGKVLSQPVRWIGSFIYYHFTPENLPDFPSIIKTNLDKRTVNNYL